jgi:hypothetical protein
LEDIEAEEMNDKLRQAARNQALPKSTGITTGTPGSSDAVTLNAMILFIGIVGLLGLVSVLGSIFIFPYFWTKSF